MNHLRYFVQFSKTLNKNFWSIPQLPTIRLHHFNTFYVREIGSLRLYDEEGLLLGSSRARIRKINDNIIRTIDIYNQSIKIAEIRISIVRLRNNLNKIDNMVIEFNLYYPQLIYNTIHNDNINRIIIREIFTVIKCSICLNTLNNVRTTSCGHAFCFDCLNMWIVNRNNCPICRAIVNPNMYYESFIVNNIINTINRYYNHV